MANTQTVTVNVLADTKRFSSSMKSAGGDTDLLTKSLKGFGVAAGVAFAAAVAGAVAYSVEAVKAAANSEAISRGMENAVKNAGLFGDTAQDIAKATGALDKHSTKLGELIGIDDELFNQIKTGWLAVPSLANLGTDGINKLAEVTADVSAGTGKDLQSIALAFTKVAGDTETALGKLTRQGIVLDDAQKETYESLLATNGEAEAQAYLIEQLGNKYKGAAEATADPFKRLDVIFGNLSESIGLTFLPILEDTIPKIQEFVTGLQSDPEFQAFLGSMATELQNIMEWLPGAVANLQSFGDDALPAVQEFLPLVNEAMGLLVEFLFGVENSKAGDSTRSFADSMEELAGSLNQITGVIRDLRAAWDNLPEPIKWIIGQIANNINPFSKLQPALDLLGNNGTTSNVQAYRTGGLKLAEGGVVMPRPGGVQATIAEAGEPEAVIPLSKMGSMGTTVVINGNVGYDAVELAREIARRQAQVNALSGVNRLVGVS